MSAKEEKEREDPVKAWSKDDKEEEKRTFNSSYEIIQDYSEYSTIQGFIYIFFAYQTVFGKIFWILVVILMSILGLYWCIKAYIDWQDKPVLTTITTTAFNIRGVEYPAVTICSPGISEDNLEAGFFKHFFAFLAANKITAGVSPYNASFLLNWNGTLTTAEMDVRTKLETYLQGDIYQKFLKESFPGLNSNDTREELLKLLKMLTSKSPDAEIVASVALDGGYDPCANTSSTSGKRKKRAAQSICDEGFVVDTANRMCYKSLLYSYYKSDGMDTCVNVYSAELVMFADDAYVQGFLALLKSGISLPDAESKFFVQSQKTDGVFYIFGQPLDHFPTLVFSPLNNGTGDDYQCLVGSLNSDSTKIKVAPADCWVEKPIVCQQYGKTDCSSSPTFVKKNTFDYLLDPKLDSEKKKAVSAKKAALKEMLKRLDQSAAYQAIFSILWYASLPCYDLKNTTGNSNGERSLLKYCEWKGTVIPCAAIFNAFPTDRGMCCSFNMKAAEDIFQSGTYPKLLKQMQDTDRYLSLEDSNVPKNYKDRKEPTTLPGRSKSLVLMLDAHTDILAMGSLDSDYDGFMGLIGPAGNFPLMSQEAFEIKPGHNNIVSLTGSRIDAESDLDSLPVEQRNCLFETENDGITIFKNYTYTNCMLECSILFAKSQLATNESNGCMPWYFPSPAGSNITFCDPWESVKFYEQMSLVPDDECTDCLPDCSATIFEPLVTSVPFRRCDSNNLGVSRFCNLNNKNLPQPTKFATQIMAEYQALGKNENFLKNLQSNIRTYSLTTPGGDVFTQNAKTYDAYDKDIAMVQIFFRQSTVFQMGSQPRMTWIDYMSTVGGLLGLVLGMGIVSFIELIWLCLRLGARKWNLTHLVP